MVHCYNLLLSTKKSYLKFIFIDVIITFEDKNDRKMYSCYDIKGQF